MHNARKIKQFFIFYFLFGGVVPPEPLGARGTRVHFVLHTF